MEASVKAVNKRTGVARSIFGEIEYMISTTQAGFEVAQNRIDPVEFWQILRLAIVRDDCPVLAACISNPGKTTQSIRSDYTT